MNRTQSLSTLASQTSRWATIQSFRICLYFSDNSFLNESTTIAKSTSSLSRITVAFDVDPQDNTSLTFKGELWSASITWCFAFFHCARFLSVGLVLVAQSFQEANLLSDKIKAEEGDAMAVLMVGCMKEETTNPINSWRSSCLRQDLVILTLIGG